MFDIDTMPKQFEVFWHGSRSNKKRLFTVSTDQRLSAFKRMVFRNFHGSEIDSSKFEFEEDWSDAHNVRIKNYSKVCHKDRETWQFYIDHLGIDISTGAPPLDVTFQLALEGGVRGKTIGGTLKWTTENADKLRRLPQAIETLVNARFDDDDLKAFVKGFTEAQIEEFVELWDHSKVNNKFKVHKMMEQEPNMKFVDQTCELVDRYRQQFKDRFIKSFSPDDIREQLAYQVRKRSEAAAMAD